MRGWLLSVIVAIAMGAAAPAARAGSTAEHPTPPASAALERIKALAGSWRGRSVMEGQDQPVSVDYHVTSGGSAVVETLFPGTPHEMVSVYHDQDGALAMTHYCMMGNQPRLALQDSSPQQMRFSLAPDGGVDPNAAHMHALTLAWADPNHLTQTWTSYANGQPQGETVITLERAQ